MKTFLRTLSALTLLALAACQFPNKPHEGVTILIQSPSRSIVPSVEDLADQYTISLTSTEHTETFTKVLTSVGAVDFVGVPAGSWLVQVVATKASTIVAVGSIPDFQVAATGGSVASVVLVGDKSGTGGYHFELVIPNDAGVTAVEAQLFDLDDNAIGDPLSPTSTVGDDDSTYVWQQTGINGGDYRLALTVKRGEVVVGRFSEAVNVWTGQTSGLWLAPDGSLHTARTLALGDLAEGNAALSNVVLTNHVALDPVFASVTTTYAVAADLGTQFTLTPTQSVDGQTIEFKVNEGDWAALPSGQTSTVLTVASGGTFALRVTAPDRQSTQEYSFAYRVDELVYRSTGADSGAPPADGTDYSAGDTVTVRGNPGSLTRAGYQFAGWNTEPDATGTTYAPGGHFTSTGGPTTLYPIWIENKFTFTNSPTYPQFGSSLQLTGVSGPVNGTLTVPMGVTSLGWGFLDGDETVTGVQLPSTLLYLEQSSLDGLPNLTTLELPDSVTGLGNESIRNCGVTSLTIGAGVTNLGTIQPVQSTIFTGYVVDADNPNYSSIDGALYNKDGTELLGVPGATSGSYTVASGVTTVSNYSFMGSGVSSVTIPASVTTIGMTAFYSATQMTSYTVDPSNTAYATSGGILYNKALTQLISMPWAYSGVLTIPDGVTSLAEEAAVSRHFITDVVFPASLTTIGQHALSNLNGLTTLTIPATVTTLGFSALASCYSLTSLAIDGSPTIYDEAFNYCNSLTSLTLSSETPPPMAFSWSTPFTEGHYNSNLVIWVPASAVAAYRAAPGWSTYADRIQAAP